MSAETFRSVPYYTPSWVYGYLVSKKMPMHPECTGIYHSKHHFQDQNLLYSHVEM